MIEIAIQWKETLCHQSSLSEAKQVNTQRVSHHNITYIIAIQNKANNNAQLKIKVK